MRGPPTRCAHRTPLVPKWGCDQIGRPFPGSYSPFLTLFDPLRAMPIKLYDLVTKRGTGVFFSNNCSPVRLALLAKGVDFVTEEVEYPDLRFTWTPVLARELGVEKATGASSPRHLLHAWRLNESAAGSRFSLALMCCLLSLHVCSTIH